MMLVSLWQSYPSKRQVSVTDPSHAALHAELAGLIVSTLQLETPTDAIDPQAALFGDGLGLDSIDALEISLAIARQYGVELKSNDAHNGETFASLAALADYVARHRVR